MKVALCFIISQPSGVLNKEALWREWIEQNKDIITVYFHYKRHEDINSEWILQHCLPKKYIVDTDYLHIVPAYMSLLQYSVTSDSENQWFCFLTDSCVPIMTPIRFRELFLREYDKSRIHWFPPSWNIHINKRANLQMFTEEFHLAHDPWFILTREDACRCLRYRYVNHTLYKVICSGAIANESIFAIILQSFGTLDNVKNVVTHLTDWSRMMSATSPYLFTEGSKKDGIIIDQLIKASPDALFLRKVAPEFPDAILSKYMDAYDPQVEKRRMRIYVLEWYHFFRLYWMSLIFFCIGSGMIGWLIII